MITDNSQNGWTGFASKFAVGFHEEHYQDKCPFLIEHSPDGCMVAIAKGVNLRVYWSRIHSPGRVEIYSSQSSKEGRIEAIKWSPFQGHELLVAYETGVVSVVSLERAEQVTPLAVTTGGADE